MSILCRRHGALLTVLLRVLSLFTKESSFNPRSLPDLGGSKSDRWSVVGILFCMLILTVGSRLCTFCRLHLRTFRDHCRAARATPPEHDLGLRYFGLF